MNLDVIKFSECFAGGENFFESKDWSAIKMINILSGLGEFLSKSTLSHPNVQRLLKTEKHFDAVVTEVFWVEALYGKSLVNLLKNVAINLILLQDLVLIFPVL
jgi:hypothetical protein